MHTFLRKARFGCRSLLRLALVLCSATLVLNGCASNLPVPSPEPSPWNGPATTTETGETLGERLGRLDAQMQVAESDSMRILQREYDSLLALAAGPGADSSLLAMRVTRQQELGQEQITTGPPSSDQSYTSAPPSDGSDSAAIFTSTARQGDTVGTIPSTPRRTIDGEIVSDVPVDQVPLSEDTYTSRPRRRAGTSIKLPVTSTTPDPRRFKGLRESEKRTIPGYRPARSTSKPKRPAVAAVRRKTVRSTAPRRTAIATYSPRNESNRGSSGVKPLTAAQRDARMSERNIVEGIAAERAGKYSEATKRLGAVKGGPKTPQARFSYALSLERTGELSRAASEYLALSSGGGALGHKAYIGYCRVLSMLGQRGRARELVQRFIRQNPASGQVASARRLLQTL